MKNEKALRKESLRSKTVKRKSNLRPREVHTPIQVEFCQSLGVFRPIQKAGHMNCEEASALLGISIEEVEALAKELNGK